MKKVFVLILLLLNASHSGACNISNLILSSSNIDLTSQPSPEFEVRVVAGSVGAGCDFFITIDNGASGGALSSSQRSLLNGSATLPIQFYADAGRTQVIKDFPEVTSANDVLMGHYSAGDSPVKTLYIRPLILPLGHYSRFGSFANSFTLKTYIGTPDSFVYDRQRSLSLTYLQPKRIDLSLVETGAPFNLSDNNQDINFGNLLSGDIRSFDVVVNFNAGYELRFSSTQGGFLKHSSLAAKVPYQLSVNGQIYSLVGSDLNPVNVSNGTWASPIGGLRIPVTIQVGALNQAPPGQYQDQIMVTVQTTE